MSAVGRAAGASARASQRPTRRRQVLGGPPQSPPHAPLYRPLSAPRPYLRAGSHTRLAAAEEPRPVEHVSVEPAAAASPSGAGAGGVEKGEALEAMAQPGVYFMVVLAALAAALADVGKVCVSVAMVPMSEVFGWTSANTGTLQSAFFWGFMVMQLPAGYASARFGGRFMLAVGVALMSLGTALTPLVAEKSVFPGLFFARVLVGLGQGCAPTAFANLLGRWLPVTERSRGTGAVFSGFNMGNICGLLVTPVLCAYVGWKAVFYLAGATGAVWLVLWKLLKLDPPSGEEDSRAGKGTTSKSALKLPWGAFLKNKSVWAAVAAHWSDNWGKFSLLAFMPTFFKTQFGMSLGGSAFLSLLPPLAGIVVAGFATTWADRRIAEGDPITGVRKLTMAVALLAPAVCLVGAALAPNAWSAAVALTAALGLARFALASLYCVHSDMSPKYGSTLLGITNTFGAGAGVVSTALTGYLYEQTGSWALSLFAPACITYALGCVVFCAWLNAEPYDFDKDRPASLLA